MADEADAEAKGKSLKGEEGMLNDKRFKSMFEDADFVVDEMSAEYRMLHPNLNTESGRRKADEGKQLVREHFEQEEESDDAMDSDAEELDEMGVVPAEYRAMKRTQEKERAAKRASKGSLGVASGRVEKPERRSAPAMYAAKEPTSVDAFRKGESNASAMGMTLAERVEQSGRSQVARRGLRAKVGEAEGGGGEEVAEVEVEGGEAMGVVGEEEEEGLEEGVEVEEEEDEEVVVEEAEEGVDEQLTVNMKRTREAKEKEEQEHKEEEEAEEEEEHAEGESGDESSSDGDSDDFPSVSSAEEDDSDDDSDGPDEKEIIIDFEFFGPKEIDYHGLKSVLNTYLDGLQYDCAGLVNAIIKQDNVGNVVKTTAEDDPFAVFTALNLEKHSAQEWVKELKAFLESNCKDSEMRAKVSEVFKSSDVAIMLTERLMNAPPKLAPPLLQFLLEEIDEASKDTDLSQEERNLFKFKKYLVATRVYEDDSPHLADAGGAGPSSSKKQKKVAKAGSGSSAPVTVFLRPEDEFLHKHCSWSYTFPVEGKSIGKDDLKPLRMVMLVDSSKMAAVRKEMDAVVGNMAFEQSMMPPPQLPMGKVKGKA
eukprot:gene5814-6100_t